MYVRLSSLTPSQARKPDVHRRGRMMSTATNTIEEFAGREYEHGFITDIEADSVPPGLNEDIVRLISARKNEPAWLLDWRLKAFRHWQTLEEPRWWPNVTYPPI